MQKNVRPNPNSNFFETMMVFLKEFVEKIDFENKVSRRQKKMQNYPACKDIISGLQIYGGPGSLSHDFKIWPITFQGSGATGPIHFSCEKSHFNKNNHLTASLRTPQNRKYM